MISLIISSKSMALLLYALLYLFASPVTADLIYHICGTTTGNFSSNSSYSTDLNHLLSTVSSIASSTGFAANSSGDTFGLALCRGDTNSDACRVCISNAISDIQNLCPNNKEAAIWYDYCQLRYSNQDFLDLPNVTNSYQYALGNGETVFADELLRIEILSTALMGNLSDLAVRNASRLFATGEAALSSKDVIYGLVQCTGDLSVGDCRTCLQELVGMTKDDVNGRLGRRAVGMWCDMRHEFYKFYNGTSMLQLSSNKPPSSPSPTNVSTPISAPAPPDVSLRENSSNTTKTVLIIALPVGFALALVCAFFILQFWKKRALKRLPIGHPLQKENLRSSESLFFYLDTIRKATNDFSEENKLGEGGFGPVYKGILEDGQHIAVKRLSRTSTQGFVEMKNEVALVVKLQHKNLVRLLGCCLEDNEMMLIYEYLPKTSLEKYLFDPTERPQLDWETRYKIIKGIGRGLLYLHEDSRLKIIHRDLKASNILLDNDMVPKISDFGLARLFHTNQTQQNTNRIAGTRGYMAPEYVMNGLFCTKSDVFSYGVLVLEIITSKKNGIFDLLCYVWKNWNQGTALQVVDQCLRNEFQSEEVLRCLHVGLLCVQENMLLRPSMATVMVMISSHSNTILAPSAPPIYGESNSNGDPTYST